MNRLHIITLSFLILIASSCKKEDAPTIESELIGRWTLELLHSVGNPEPFPHTDGMEYTFRTDGTFSGIFIETFYNDGKLNTIKVPYHGTYRVSNDKTKLTILEDGDDPDEYLIHHLSSEKLVLRGARDEFGQTEFIYTKN